MKRAAILLMLALWGCGDGRQDEGAPEPPQAEPQTSVVRPSPAPPAGPTSTERDVAAPGRRLPPPETAMRFVGSWAADAASCAGRAWRFTLTSLDTPAGSACRLFDVKPVPGGYDIPARCTAEGPARDDLLRLRFAESAQAMMFESDSIADAGLVYCGPAG